MTLIKSISGIRGTIGGRAGEGLSPLDVVKFTASYSTFMQSQAGKKKMRIVVGRDARISGEMVNSLVVGTLMGMGVDVVNIGLATTPTTELAVTAENADGGIILTASHNPKQWNALKLLNADGEFLNDKAGKEILSIADSESFTFAEVDDLGIVTEKDYTDYHVDHVLNLDLVDVEVIKAANFKVAIDSVNSVGGIAIPKLLKALGVEKTVEINCEATGHFAHVPEPLPENLVETSEIINKEGVDVGFVVDPDVDRLAIINEDGSMFNEEYTLAAVADYVLSKTPGNTVSNLSSSRVLRDVTEKYGCSYAASAVGEVNVVAQMKATNAIIGGEGNGGVIYPTSHSGRDALVGIGLFLTHLANKKMKCSELRATYPSYFISKNKIQLTPEIDVDQILAEMEKKYSNEQVNNIDGVKIDFADRWVHLRKSNTEPIIRIYSEAPSMDQADALANAIIEDIKGLI
ncbi:phosphoglucosamine mutase [Halosquirtibacter laminarini]|uniref:Phosphoglucosamine mutase n=1 Tax=Halosquirtibacter laminarini TaxID=3374600 RepID=A0AC61NFH5_9BACT|nr:phosphoglucosamine mutase [Prolixibacteraceae bacterium]